MRERVCVRETVNIILSAVCVLISHFRPLFLTLIVTHLYPVGSGVKSLFVAKAEGESLSTTSSEIVIRAVVRLIISFTIAP